jgi:hypothetical protein
VADSDLGLVIKIPTPRCPQCRKEGLELVSWLVTHDEIPCLNGCGAVIDLRSDEYRAFLDKCKEAIEQIRPSYEKLP